MAVRANKPEKAETRILEKNEKFMVRASIEVKCLKKGLNYTLKCKYPASRGQKDAPNAPCSTRLFKAQGTLSWAALT